MCVRAHAWQFSRGSQSVAGGSWLAFSTMWVLGDWIQILSSGSGPWSRPSSSQNFYPFLYFFLKSTQMKTHSLWCIRVNTYKTPLKWIKMEYFQSPPKNIPGPSLISLYSPKGTHLLIFVETTLLMLFVPDTCFAFWTLHSKLDVLWRLMTSAQHYLRHPFPRVATVYLFSGLYIAFLWEYITALPTLPLAGF